VIFAIPISQLEFGAHSITTRVFARGGGRQAAEAVVEFLIIPDPMGLVDLNAVPGSPTAIRAAQEVPPAPPVQTPPVPPTPPTPPTPALAQAVLAPETAAALTTAARYLGYAGSFTEAGTFVPPRSFQSYLFAFVVDQYGRLVREGSLKLTRPDGRWASFLPWDDGMFYIIPREHTQYGGGVVPGETVVVSLKHDNLPLARVQMPPAGQGLWLPISVQR